MTKRWPLLRRASAQGVTCRERMETDLLFLRQLYRSTREEELNRVPWSEAEKQAFSDMQFRAQDEHYGKHYPDALWLILERGGRQVGRLYLERWSSEHRIIDISLMPDFRGQGIGGAILRDLMDEAAADGRSVGIHVEKMNPAMTLYRRLGFEAIEDKGIYDLLMWRSAT